MVYTKKHPTLFIIGVIMLVLWYLGDSGALSGYYEHLAAGKKYKYGGEIATLPFYFGIVAVLIGARRNIPNSMGGVLSAGMGVCGVSATGILNSAQVAGAALAFQPDGIETLKVESPGHLFNYLSIHKS